MLIEHLSFDLHRIFFNFPPRIIPSPIEFGDFCFLHILYLAFLKLTNHYLLLLPLLDCTPDHATSLELYARYLLFEMISLEIFAIALALLLLFVEIFAE